MEPFAMFIGDGSITFRKESKRECRKYSFSDMLHQQQALFDENICYKISLQFPAFSCPIKCVQAFPNSFQALLSVEFNFILSLGLRIVV